MIIISKILCFRHLIRLPLFFLIAGLLFSCEHLPLESGIPIIRRPNWWNFYQRGVAYSLKGNWEKAAADFETALGYQEGAIYPESSEKRRAKTYGLHFLNDYFPHRELGICYYYQEQHEKAESELNKSIEMLPSSRARHYLDNIRQAQYRQLGTPQPGALKLVVKTNLGSDPKLTNSPYITIDGTVSSPYLVSRVVVNGRRLFLKSSEDTYKLHHKTALKTGPQTLKVVARDLAGNSEVWEHDLFVDLQGPTISFAPSVSDPKSYIRMIVMDNFGIASVIVNGKEVKIDTSKKMFSSEIPAGGEDGEAALSVLSVLATDPAGNRTELKSPLRELLKASLQSRKHYPDTQQASSGSNLILAFNESLNANIRFDPDVRSDVQSDVRYDFAMAPQLPKKQADTLPPRLRMFPDIDEKTVVTTDLYVLDLEVSDSGYLDSVEFRINGATETRSLRDLKLIKHRFTQTFELQPGANALEVIVRDHAGNKKVKTFAIEQKLDAIWREDLRITAQVIPPDKSAVARLAEVDIYSSLLQALLGNPKRLNIVERDPETMQRLLMELKLSESRLADQVRAVKTGKLRQSDWILQGHLTEWSGEDNWDIVVNIVDVATSKYLVTTDIHFTEFSLEHIEFQLQGLVDKLHQRLPALSATVAGAVSKGIKIPLGTQDNIFEGMRFIFISGAEEDVDFADPMMWGEQWIQGQAKLVKDNMCLVEIFPKEAKDQIKADDLAILR